MTFCNLQIFHILGEGISNVVESGLGIPPPEEAAKLSVAERRKLLEGAQKVKEPEPSMSSDEGSGQSPEGSQHHFPMNEPPQQHNTFGGFFGGFGSIVNGSLDVLETIGKKTFETLTVKSDVSFTRISFRRSINLSFRMKSDGLFYSQDRIKIYQKFCEILKKPKTKRLEVPPKCLVTVAHSPDKMVSAF